MPPYLRLVDVSACWNGSKMIWCLSGGMPMPVSRTEKKSTMSRLVQDLVVAAPAPGRHADVELHLALGRELEGVRQQVAQDLLDALRVRLERDRQVRIQLDLEVQLLGERDRAERGLRRRPGCP